MSESRNTTAAKISIGTLLLVALGVVADLTGLWTSATGKTLQDVVNPTPKPPQTGTTAPTADPASPTADCDWKKAAGDNPAQREVGTPPTSVPSAGDASLILETNLGAVRATLDRSHAPCAVASFSYLAEKQFFDGTTCHRLVHEPSFKVLQCGDPSATGNSANDGQGGPTYVFAEENLPVGKSPTYPAGVIAMAKTADPNTTGSQFFIVYGDTDLNPSYTVLGTVVAGLDILNSVGTAGHDNAFGSNGGGHPKKKVVITKATVSKR